MSSAPKIASGHVESWARICERHPDEWVCLVGVEYDPNGAIKTALVVAHDLVLSTVLRRAESWGEDAFVTQTEGAMAYEMFVVASDEHDAQRPTM